MASGKLLHADVAELNPSFDIDNRTARVAARLVNTLLAPTLVSSAEPDTGPWFADEEGRAASESTWASAFLGGLGPWPPAALGTRPPDTVRATLFV